MRGHPGFRRVMSDRAAMIASALEGTPWANWEKAPITGDASSRQYMRLSHGTDAVILMDAGLALTAQTDTFIQIAQWLVDQGFCAPKILHHDTSHGLLVLEDLGQSHFAAWIDHHPNDAATLYMAANNVLISLAKTQPPTGLPQMTPQIGGEMVQITGEWYAANTITNDLVAALSNHLHQLCGPPNTVALRDFHAENLIWRPAQVGHNRVGLLDFQDAFIAPLGYDLVSLLRDVRRDVDAAIATSLTTAFCDAHDLSLVDGRARFACLAVQRNLRILGVFARLARQDGKTRYIAMIPRIWRMLTEDLAHPALSDLRNVVHATLPPPDKSEIRGLL